MTIMAMSSSVVLGRLTAASIILNMLLGDQPRRGGGAYRVGDIL
jgi:hypothetical protein